MVSKPAGSRRTSKFTERHIVAILKQADAGVAGKKHLPAPGVSSSTCYQCKSKYRDLKASAPRSVKELEAENA